MGKIIIAPHKEIPEGSLVYLGGPLAFSPDWHSDAIALLQINKLISIASPREARDIRVEKTPEEKIKYLEWKQYYSEYAYQKGVVMFWFPKEQEGSSESKAMFEFGEAITRTCLQNTKLLVGIEPGFEGDAFIRNIITSKKLTISIADSLEDLCEQVLITTVNL